VIAESATDASGLARFNLTAPGGFTLAPKHPANHLDWVELDVVADVTPATQGNESIESAVELKWPSTAILKTRQLRGSLSDGLMSSRGSPLKQASLSVRELVSYVEVAKLTTSDTGSFQFDNLPEGLYFLQISGGTGKDSHTPGGDISVYISADNKRNGISVATTSSSCGLSYDLEENKARYKPVACFKAGKPVPCKY
jgi:hypothetical protein